MATTSELFCGPPPVDIEWRKYKFYSLLVDPEQDDRAKEIKLCHFDRPHMRAFHCSWWAFFVAFFVWFSITPLLAEIQDDLNLTNADVWSSSVAAVASTIGVRVLLGPACDKFGARVLFALCLCTAAIPTALTGLIRDAKELIILRAFIGIAGGSFVMCQYWTSRMFTREIVGTANALAAGWGNLGAGVTQIFVGSLLFPLFRVFFNGDSEKAWRSVLILPAILAFVTGVLVYYMSDDSPKGNYSELKQHGVMKDVSLMSSLQRALNWNTFILAVQYACCFGIELNMNNAAILYFRDEFDQTPEVAAVIASIFGWMNLFARGIGGFWSDYANVTRGMKGRLWVLTFLLLGEGISVLVFARTGSLPGAIILMVIFSLFVQSAEGAVYGIVPYVDPQYTGSVSGIVGAGGNVGATCFGLAFRQLGTDYSRGFTIMGCTILVSSLLSGFIFIEGQSNIWTNEALERELYPDGRIHHDDDEDLLVRHDEVQEMRGRFADGGELRAPEIS